MEIYFRIHEYRLFFENWIMDMDRYRSRSLRWKNKPKYYSGWFRCERKTQFQLKNNLKKTDYKRNEWYDRSQHPLQGEGWYEYSRPCYSAPRERPHMPLSSVNLAPGTNIFWKQKEKEKLKQLLAPSVVPHFQRLCSDGGGSSSGTDRKPCKK